MKVEDWKQIENLYCAALDSEPANRPALLVSVAPEIRQAVEKMLASSSGDQVLDRSLWIDSEHFWPRIILDPGTQVGPYTIQSLIGEGGMGAVYGASDLRLNRQVAIKILPQLLAANQNRLRQFELEARAAGSLNHPNILTVHDVGSQDDLFYLVTELLDGETLRARLNRNKLARQEALPYIRMIAAGLAAAHEKGITHRDLKPENIFLTRDGRLKIVDFGLAKFAVPESGTVFTKATEEDTSRTLPTILVGTVGYMSPEQVQGLPIDTRSDIFNFGIVIFEMLTGQRPFLGSTPLETLQDVVNKEPQLSVISEIDPVLGRFVGHCLEKDPLKRFQSASDVLRELEKYESPQPATLSRRRAALYIAGGASLAAGLAWMRPRAENVPKPLTPAMRGNITTARFTRDGRSIVVSAGRDGDPVAAYKMSVTGGDLVPLGIPAGIAAISATDELALMLHCEINWGECRGTLATMPLAGGEPKEIEGIEGKVEYADWGPDGELAIVRFVRNKSRIEYPIGTELLRQDRGWISHVRVSPKGDSVAFLSHPNLDDISGAVEVVDLQGERKTLAAGHHGLKGLAWTPAGDEVWFSGGDNYPQPVLWAVTLNKRQRIVQKIAGWFELLDIGRDGGVLMMQQRPNSSVVYEPKGGRQSALNGWATLVDLSSDASELLINGGDSETRRAKRIVRLHNSLTGKSRQIGEGKPLALSPDGRWALATRSTPNPELVLFPSQPGEPRPLPRTDGIAEYRSGFWLDRNQVIFVGEREGGSVRSYIQSIEGGPARLILDADVWAAVASPDGTELAAYGKEREDYYRLSSKGEPRPRLLGGLKPYDELLRWGSDQSLYVRSSEHDRVDVFKVDLATGARKLFKSLVPNPEGFLGVEATLVTPDGKTVVYNYWSASGQLYLVEGVL